MRSGGGPCHNLIHTYIFAAIFQHEHEEAASGGQNTMKQIQKYPDARYHPHACELLT
jgi:hypothetical protein